MKRLALVLTLLALVAGPVVQASPPPYNWTLSASDTNPFVNSATPTFGVRTIHLWLVSAAQGMQSSDFQVIGNVTILTVASRNGFLVDLGNDPTTHVFCPGGPLIAADVLILDLPGNLCFSAASADGGNCTLDCAGAALHENSFIGWATDGSAPCFFESWGACVTWPTPAPDGLTPSDWGRMKSLYR